MTNCPRLHSEIHHCIYTDASLPINFAQPITEHIRNTKAGLFLGGWGSSAVTLTQGLSVGLPHFIPKIFHSNSLISLSSSQRSGSYYTLPALLDSFLVPFHFPLLAFSPINHLHVEFHFGICFSTDPN